MKAIFHPIQLIKYDIPITENASPKPKQLVQNKINPLSYFVESKYWETMKYGKKVKHRHKPEMEKLISKMTYPQLLK